MLTRNHRQEVLCRAYVQAVAARCGMSASMPTPDYGIDLTLHDIEIVDGRRAESGFRIDIQAKSTVRAGADNSRIRYDLDRRAYDNLRVDSVGCPRILVVLVLPRKESDWLRQTQNELAIRRCAYWVSLKGRPPAGNRKSLRLYIPRAKVFSAAALAGIMRRIKRGEEP